MRRRSRLRFLLDILGPGLITGAADDDPSGIATYSQAGAQFGFGLTWTMFLTLPFMAAIQIISACIGWQTRSGLVKAMATQVPKSVVYLIVLLLVCANTINIAADLAAMGEALRLVVGGPAAVYALGFGLSCLAAEIIVPYHRYAGYLKFLTLKVAISTVIPQPSFNRDMLLTIVAVFGTTISPYLFFWQASQEAEESQLSFRRRHGARRERLDRHFGSISLDTWTGMAFSNVIAWFIIVTTAVTLHANGITLIDTAAQAADALRPIAGDLTFALFALGIIGTGLLAVPVLAGSAAYAVAEAFGLRGSLELPANRALGFYSIVAAATMAGTFLTLTDINPISMLFWTAVINGIVAVPIMLLMMVIISSARGQRAFALPRFLLALGWLSALLMTLSVFLLCWSSLEG